MTAMAVLERIVFASGTVDDEVASERGRDCASNDGEVASEPCREGAADDAVEPRLKVRISAAICKEKVTRLIKKGLATEH